MIKSGNGWKGEVYGTCPVEGEGEIEGLRWHFRSRGSKWTINIENHPELASSEEWGEWPDAGYMHHDEAWKLIINYLEKTQKKLI